MSYSKIILRHSQFLYGDIVQEGREWINKNKFIGLIIIASLGPAFLALPLVIAKSFYISDFIYQIITSFCLSGLVIASTHAFSKIWQIHIFDSYLQCLPVSKLHIFFIHSLFQLITNAVFLLICLATMVFSFYANLKGEQENNIIVLAIYITVILWANDSLNRYFVSWLNKLLCLMVLSYLIMNELWLLLSAALIGLFFITQYNLHIPPFLKYKGRSLTLFLCFQPTVAIALSLYICIWLIDLIQPTNHSELIAFLSFLVVIIIGNTYSWIISFYKKFEHKTAYLPVNNSNLKIQCMTAIGILFTFISLLISVQYLAVEAISTKLLFFNTLSAILGLIFAVTSDKVRIPIQLVIMITYFLEAIS